ncbi:MAG: hypothetical protein ACLUOP_12975 [Intestinibacter bartlettii]
MITLIKETKEGLDLLDKSIEKILSTEIDKKFYKIIILVLTAIVLIFGILVYKSIMELNIIIENGQEFVIEKIIIIILIAYLLVLLLSVIFVIIFREFIEYKNCYKCAFGLLLINTLPILFIGTFVNMYYIPRKNNTLFILGVFMIFINLISMSFLWGLFLRIYPDYSQSSLNFIMFIILAPKFIIDCINHFIIRINKIQEIINKGYGNIKEDMDTLDYNSRYLKHLVYRTQLLLLIIIYYLVIVNPEAYDSISGNFINAVSAVTLGMLYLDKRKEWNLKEDDLL